MVVGVGPRTHDDVSAPDVERSRGIDASSVLLDEPSRWLLASGGIADCGDVLLDLREVARRQP